MMTTATLKAPGEVTEDIDWWSIQYVSLDDLLVCPICRTGLVDPHCTACGHTFCRECLAASAHTTDVSNECIQCPIDRSRLSSPPQPATFLVKSLLDEQEVYCPHREQGCEFIGKRWVLEAHIAADCEYVPVLCHPPCSKSVQRRHFNPDRCVCDDAPTASESTPPSSASASASASTAASPVLSSSSPLTTAYSPSSQELEEEAAAGGHEESEATAEPASTGSDVGAQAIAQCPGSNLGCPEEVASEDHIYSCPLARIHTAMQKQSNRIDALVVENRALKHRLELATQQARHSAAELDSQILVEYDRMIRDIQATSVSQANQQKMMLSLAADGARTAEDMTILRSTVDSMRRQLHLMALSQRRMSMYSPIADADADDATRMKGAQKL